MSYDEAKRICKSAFDKAAEAVAGEQDVRKLVTLMAGKDPELMEALCVVARERTE
jgi:hypothetical protein